MWSYLGSIHPTNSQVIEMLIKTAGYWTVSESNLSAWSLGSTLLAFGLSPAEAIGVLVRHLHLKCAITLLLTD